MRRTQPGSYVLSRVESHYLRLLIPCLHSATLVLFLYASTGDRPQTPLYSFAAPQPLWYACSRTCTSSIKIQKVMCSQTLVFSKTLCLIISLLSLSLLCNHVVAGFLRRSGGCHLSDPYASQIQLAILKQLEGCMPPPPPLELVQNPVDSLL
jgi:hypothetical protein